MRRGVGDSTLGHDLPASDVSHLDSDEDVRQLVLACFCKATDRPSPQDIARGLTNLARGLPLDVSRAGSVPTWWNVPEVFGSGGRPSSAEDTGGTTSAPVTSRRVPDAGSRRYRRASVGIP